MFGDKAPDPRAESSSELAQSGFESKKGRRRFRIRFTGGAEYSARVIDRDSVNFHDGFVVFSNGGEYMISTDVIAYSRQFVWAVEELDVDHPGQS